VVCSLAVEVEIPDPVPVKGERVGVDRGLTHFAVLSTGKKTKAPKSLEKRLQRLSGQHSRKQKGSTNRRKLAIKLAKLHHRIKEKTSCTSS